MKPIQGCLVLVLLALSVAACSPAAASTYVPPPVASETAPMITPNRSATDPHPTSTIKLEATRTPQPHTSEGQTTPETRTTPQGVVCPSDVCILDPGFPLARPIAAPGRVMVDSSYRFGGTQGGERDPHHGVEFLNSAGTPVLAAADGRVIVAGDDLRDRYSPYFNYYGSLVILEHELEDYTGPVFTLYAHLSEVSVAWGDRVRAGDQVGLVGLSGVATGSHLHFEVRMGDNHYLAARNPELWLAPIQDRDGRLTGAIAGRVIDENGEELSVENVVIEPLSSGAPGNIYLNSYQEKALIGQPPWEESFAVGELPAGRYRISFVRSGIQQREVQVQPGKLTLVTFRIRAWEGE